jgi:CubicO group peptidase (beta-lactamase class C family)
MLNTEHLEAWIKEEMDKAGVPALAYGIIKGEEIICANGLGTTSVEAGGIAVTPETLFRIASVTKPHTGTMVMQLVEESLLDLDRPVVEYLSGFHFREDIANEQITLRMLLSHSAGLPTHHVPEGGREVADIELYIFNELSEYELLAPPGTLYSYANPGTRMAAYLAQVVTGTPYFQLMQERIFDPLEMRLATFDPLVALTYPFAQAHRMDDEGKLVVQHRYTENTSQAPSGNIISNVLDLSNLVILHLNGGRFGSKRLLSEETVRLMHLPVRKNYTLRDSGYGLTFGTEVYKGVRIIGHNGAISTYGSMIKFAPEHGVGLVMLYNRRADDFPSVKIQHHIFDELLNLPEQVGALQPIVTEPSQWERHVGAYLGDRSGLVLIEADESGLSLVFNGKRHKLTPIREDLYIGEETGNGLTVGFIPPESGATQFIMVNGLPCRRFQYDAKYQPDKAMLEACVGIYARNFDTIRVRCQDGELWVSRPPEAKEFHCQPIGGSRFAAAWGPLEFQANENAQVQSLRVGVFSVYEKQSAAR